MRQMIHTSKPVDRFSEFMMQIQYPHIGIQVCKIGNHGTGTVRNAGQQSDTYLYTQNTYA